MKAKFLLLMLSLVLATALRAQTAPEQCVVVEQTDGLTTEYLLTSKPRITFASGVVTLTSTTATLELTAADVARVYLAPATNVGVETNRVDVARIVVGADVISLSGLEPISPVALYTIDGRLLQQALATADGTLSLPLNAQGVIIVKTKHQSFKIIR